VALLLDWSRSASGRWCNFGAVDEGCLRIRGDKHFGMSFKSRFMFLLLNTCRDPDTNQILTITPSIREECGNHSTH